MEEKIMFNKKSIAVAAVTVSLITNVQPSLAVAAIFRRVQPEVPQQSLDYEQHQEDTGSMSRSELRGIKALGKVRRAPGGNDYGWVVKVKKATSYYTVPACVNELHTPKGKYFAGDKVKLQPGDVTFWLIEPVDLTKI